MNNEVEELLFLADLKNKLESEEFKQQVYRDLYFNLIKKEAKLMEEMQKDGINEKIGNTESEHN